MRADIGGDLHKVEIGGPVLEAVGTAEGKDCKRAGVVDGHVARHACEETRTARQRERVVSMNKPTIVTEKRRRSERIAGSRDAGPTSRTHTPWSRHRRRLEGSCRSRT